jgi:hypothetical protein
MLDEYCTGKIPKSKKSKKMCFEEKNRVLVKHLMEVLKIKNYKHRTTVNCYMHTKDNSPACGKLSETFLCRNLKVLKILKGGVKKHFYELHMLTQLLTFTSKFFN